MEGVKPMPLPRKGSRLSVQPVGAAEWMIVCWRAGRVCLTLAQTNMHRRSLTLALASALLVACSSDSPSGPDAPVPSALTAVTTTTVGAIAGSAVETKPSVKVATSTGAGVPGVTVTFAVTLGGGSLTGATATTDASGTATVGSWTLGGTVGENRLTATTAALPSAAVTFVATGSVGAPASMTFSRDSLLLDQWGDTASVSVVVRDANNNVVSAPTLAWSSASALVATVSNGMATSVRTGRTLAQVTATAGTFPSIQATIPVRVVSQRNPACTAPIAVTRGAAAPVSSYSPFEIQNTLSIATWDGRRVIPFDFDNDGDDDAVRFEYSFPFSTTYSGTIKVFKNDGGVLRDSTAKYAPPGVIPDHPRDFEVADFDGDGVDELLLIQHGFDARPFPGAPNIMLRLQGGVLANVASARFPTMSASGFSHGSTTADVDCDRDLDVLELQLTPAVGNRLWINNGAGTFSDGTSRAPVIAGLAGQRWQEVEFIDFDNDGDPDLYLGARSGTGWNEDVFLVNDGFGNFRRSAAVQLPAPRFTSAHGVNNAKAADFNGDGRLDLFLFEIPEPFSTSSAARLWLNSGNGTFTDASAAWGLPALCSSELIEPLFVRDMNSDGWPDIILPRGCPELAVSGLLTNTGTRFTVTSFSSFVSFLNGDIATPMDLLGDGRIDLWFGERGGDPVMVRRP